MFSSASRVRPKHREAANPAALERGGLRVRVTSVVLVRMLPPEAVDALALTFASSRALHSSLVFSLAGCALTPAPLDRQALHSRTITVSIPPPMSAAVSAPHNLVRGRLVRCPSGTFHLNRALSLSSQEFGACRRLDSRTQISGALRVERSQDPTATRCVCAGQI